MKHSLHSYSVIRKPGKAGVPELLSVYTTMIETRVFSPRWHQRCGVDQQALGGCMGLTACKDTYENIA